MLHLTTVVFVINDLLGGDHERTARLGEDDFLADLALLETHLREVSAQLVILVLRPLLERMVVTLVAVEAHAQESLRDILGHLARLAEHAEIVHRRILVAAAFRSEQRADELVVGRIVRDLLANPVAIQPHGFLAEVLAVALEQVRPFVRPELDVIIAAEQFIDELLALLFARRLVFEEGTNLFDLGRQAGEIEIDAARELAVRSQLARENLHLAQLRVDVLVDEVVLRHIGPLIPAAVAHDGDERRPVDAFITHEQGGLATTQTFHHASRVDLGDFDVADGEMRVASHVTRGAIRIFRDDEELL